MLADVEHNIMAESKKQELESRAIDLQTKNANMNYVWTALALAGGIAGVIYASKKDKRFWGKVGFFFLGGVAVSIPTGIVVAPLMNKNKAEMKKMQLEYNDLP